MVKWRLEDDDIVLVVDLGIAGSPKYRLNVDDLAAQPDEPEVDATPAARKLAEEAGIKLEEEFGAGERVTVRDVRAKLKEKES